MGIRCCAPGLAAIVGSALLLTCLPAAASTIEDMSLGQMAEASTSIVYATVLSSTSRWNEDRTMIVTDVRIQVLESLKGSPGGTLVVTQPGGTVGKLRVDVPGASAFREGEDVVLFLGEGPAGSFQVAGLSRGRFDIVLDEMTGERRVLGFSGPSATRGGTQSLSEPGAMPRVHTRRSRPSLAEFLSEVRQLVAEDGSRD